MILLLVVTVAVLIFVYVISSYLKIKSYWKDKGVKHIKPLPLFGNSLPTITNQISTPEFLQELYRAFPNERYSGIFQFHTPVLLIRDPEIIKQVMIKEFDSFLNHQTMFSDRVDPLWGRNLFATKDDQWINLRRTLSPAFTSSKMRFMFDLINDSSQQLVKYLKSKNENLIEVELKDFFSRSTNDMIASTAFGISIDTHQTKTNEFFENGNELVDLSGFKKLKFLMYDVPEVILKALGIKIVSNKVGNFFRSIVDESLAVRKRDKVVRPDMIHLLMEAQKGRLSYEENDTIENRWVEEKGLKKIQLTDEDIAAQAMVFFFGGFDTTSSFMGFLGYELCAHPEIQARLQKEIDEVLKNGNGKVTYGDIQKMKYLDMVISEAARKWTPGIFVDRICNKPFTIQPELPHEKALTLPVGQVCWIPIYALHHDPKYFEDPEKFDPERFSEENKGKIHPGTYMPFGMGPRMCIGSRYALMVCKMLAFHLLSSFDIVTSSKTKLPLELDNHHLNVQAKHGLWYGLKRRNL